MKMPAELTKDDLMQFMVEAVRREAYKPEYRDQVSDAEVLGLIVARHCEWDGMQIFEAFSAALEDAKQALRDAGAGIILPPQLDEELVALAAANPQLMTYDPSRGMIKLASDLTFDLGSVKIKATAEAGLKELAEIILHQGAGIGDVGDRFID